MSANPSDTERSNAEKAPSPVDHTPLPVLLSRATLGGALMGMANLVPGISGGTMLLAAGVFPAFVEAVADLTRLRFNKRSLLLLAIIVVTAAIVIGSLAGVVGRLVIAHTWMMYSIFIGLTLGGVPLIWRMAGQKTPTFWTGAALGLAGMTGIAFAQMTGAGAGGNGNTGFLIMLLAGVLGASAMVLPGISGGYLLLLLGVYVPILQGIEATFTAARTFDIPALLPPVLHIVLPVGLGVAAGVAGVSNLVKVVLDRFPNATLGVLLGLLLGAVVGLWPFQHGTEPEIGATLKGQIVQQVDGVFVYGQTAEPIAPEDFPKEYFRPTPAQSAGAVGLILAGFAITAAVARFGGNE